MRILLVSLMVWTSLVTRGQQTTTAFPRVIDSVFRTVYKNDEPGVSIAIVQKGKPILKKSYGVADVETRQKITSRTYFNIGSLTKQFTAMAILQLAEQKKISLDDKVGKFFPEMNKKVADAITIKEMLSHSSGLFEHYDLTDTKNMKHAHNADVLNAIKNVDSTYFSPGTDFRYSNTAYCLLALIVEKVSGMSYSAYLKRNIFQPLGMRSSTVWSENEKIANKATGYEYDDTTKTFKRSDAEENIFFSTEGDGGIYTSIDEYLKWLNALQTATSVSRGNINLARSPHFPVNNEKKLSYGYGWFVDESSSRRIVYHTGSNGGFRACTYTIPGDGYMIVIFSNRTGVDLQKLISEINKILRPDL
jgi:CubicO group peptidase (beta-lactamase class C family)